MPTINKLIEATKITYTAAISAGDVTVVVQKTSDGSLKYNVEYTGTGDRPTWEDFCVQVEGDATINLL